ncbi:hypothetical protein FB2170_03565 [Maribacter sp. HTCC2170]|nr:hypothetical protein FB2170_03565 [Maribacter sp. HTCC2170]
MHRPVGLFYTKLKNNEVIDKVGGGNDVGSWNLHVWSIGISMVVVFSANTGP